MPRILLTGASGFVGVALSRYLLGDGFHVSAMSRNRPVIDGLNHHEGAYRWHCHDLTGDSEKIDGMLENIDVVIHLAAHVHKMGKQTSEGIKQYHLVNTGATHDLVKRASAKGVTRFIYLSTVKVHGENSTDNAIHVTDELNPLDPYAQSKALAEEKIREVCELDKMEYVIIRPPLVYGPGVGANFLRLMKLVSMGLPLPLRSIKNKRSLIYLGNLIDLISVCSSNKSAANKTFLVKDFDLSTSELVTEIARAMDKNIWLLPAPVSLLKLAGMTCGLRSSIERLTESLVLDDTPTRRDLCWKPSHTLESAIGNTVLWYLKNHQQ